MGLDATLVGLNYEKIKKAEKGIKMYLNKYDLKPNYDFSRLKNPENFDEKDFDFLIGDLFDNYIPSENFVELGIMRIFSTYTNKEYDIFMDELLDFDWNNPRKFINGYYFPLYKEDMERFLNKISKNDELEKPMNKVLNDDIYVVFSS